MQIDNKGGGSVIAKRSRTVRPSSKRLISMWRRSVSPAEVARFLERLDRIDFWNVSPEDRSMGGFDGVVWKLEAHRDGKSHVVKRWSPKPGTFLGAAIQLLGFADLAGCDGSRPLSQFELSRLKFLTTRNDGSGPIAALVEAPDGAVELVRVGAGIGADFGVIRAISADYIKISELVRNCADGVHAEWTERINYLPRSGATATDQFATTVTAGSEERDRTGSRCISGP